MSSVLASSSCVITIVETHSGDEVLDLIDMVNDFRADRKRLLILAPTFNETMFKNVTINYDVTIEHSYGGDISILIHCNTVLFWIKKSLTVADSGVIHSLCPALGKRHALVFKGLCPLNLQNPLGKEINVSFYLLPPFAMPAPARGSDFLTLKLLERKFGFIPRFNFEKFVETIANDSLIHSVS